jgi:hypothetical protein
MDIEETKIAIAGGAAAETAPQSSDFVQLAAFNQPDELVPLGVRQADGVFPFADRDALVGNFDFRASRAGRA